MELIPVKRQSALDVAIDAIRRYIIDNDLGRGAELPTEAKLADELGISRTILREAMRHYRTLGIIETKPKVGATVTRLMPQNPYKNYMPFLASNRKAVVPELAEIRYSLETGAARFIVRKATEAELARLREIAVLRESTTDFAGLRAMDMEFHSALLRATHNNLLIGMIPLIVNFFEDIFPDTRREFTAEERSRVNGEHRRILDALEARDADALETTLKSHIEPYLLREG